MTTLNQNSNLRQFINNIKNIFLSEELRILLIYPQIYSVKISLDRAERSKHGLELREILGNLADKTSFYYLKLSLQLLVFLHDLGFIREYLKELAWQLELFNPKLGFNF